MPNENNLDKIRNLSEEVAQIIENTEFSNLSAANVQAIIDASVGPVDKILTAKTKEWTQIHEPFYMERFEEAEEEDRELDFEEEHLRVITMPHRAWGIIEGEFYWHSSAGW